MSYHSLQKIEFFWSYEIILDLGILTLSPIILIGVGITEKTRSHDINKQCSLSLLLLILTKDKTMNYNIVWHQTLCFVDFSDYNMYWDPIPLILCMESIPDNFWLFSLDFTLKSMTSTRLFLSYGKSDPLLLYSENFNKCIKKS